MNQPKSQVLASANELRTLVDTFAPPLRALENDAEFAVRPHPEKWSRKEILGHLIDSACNNQQKFVRMMQQPLLEFPGYAQDDWVILQNWADANWENMVDLWRLYNLHIAYLMETVPEPCYEHEILIEGAGPFRLGFIMPDYVEHLKHHVRQIFPESDLENKFVNVYNA